MTYLKGCFLFLLIFTGFFFSFDNPEDFDSLMGKDYENFRCLAKERDVQFLNSCKDLYNQRMAEDVKDKGELRIPKILHFICIGQVAFSENSIENLKSWIKCNPDWKFVLWTDQKRAAPFLQMEVRDINNQNFAKILKRFHQAKNDKEKIDVLRYEILFSEGGLSADHRSICLRSFENLNRSFDLYCCLDAIEDPININHFNCSNTILGAKAGHPTLKRALELIDDKTKGVGQNINLDKVELKQKTYLALTDALKESLVKEGYKDIVLPTSYFFSKEGMVSLFTKQFHEGSTIDRNDDDILTQLMSDSYLKSRMSSKKFLIEFFLVCAISLIAVVMLFAMMIKFKQRYFS